MRELFRRILVRLGLREPRVSWLSEAILPQSDGTRIHEWYAPKPGKLLHREDGPARIVSTKTGVVLREEWWQDGRLHRVGAPAVIVRDEEGRVRAGHWHQHGLLHRDGGPAVQKFDRYGDIVSEEWYDQGVLVSPTQS